MRFASDIPAARMTTVLAWLLVPLALASQNSPQAPQIRVSTHLVQIGVIVRDKNVSVSNLKQNDFVVLDRGKPQEISVFSADAAVSAQQPSPQALPKNTFSDLPHYGVTAPRSVTIVLLDNLNTLYGSAPESRYEETPYWLEDLALRNAQKHLIEFIETLDPRDRVASSIPLQATVDRVSQPPDWLRVVLSIDAHDLHLVPSGGVRKGAIGGRRV
jgi:hypothetical protein